MKYIIDRLQEPSTWRGLVMLTTAFGVALNPDLVAAIVSAGTGLAGLIGVIFKDKLGE